MKRPSIEDIEALPLVGKIAAELITSIFGSLGITLEDLPEILPDDHGELQAVVANVLRRKGWTEEHIARLMEEQ